jgi:hypothetical protein
MRSRISQLKQTLVIKDEKGRILRTFKGPGTAGAHRVNGDLKDQNKTSEEAATKVV